jgi:putative methanogenesis marker protein 7
MLKYLIFEGGLYKHELMEEYLQDIGGFVVQKVVVSLDLILNIAIPEEELGRVEAMAKELSGKLKEAPLIGTEVAVVAPTLSRHHLPHPSCDIAENLRRHGAKTNIIGLSRGVGQKVVHRTIKEKELIEEHDLAVFTLGNFEHCLKEAKVPLFKELSIPAIVTGGPICDGLPGAQGYVGGLGRFPERARTGEMIERLNEVSIMSGKLVEQKRRELDLDPFVVDPIIIKEEVERQVPQAVEALSPNPVTLKVDGVRVKLPFDEYREKIEGVMVEGRRLSGLATVTKSQMRDYILIRVLPESMFVSR